MTVTANRALLVVVALAGFTFRALFLLNTPIDQAERIGALSSYGDERAHVEYTRHILNTGSLPHSASAITSASGVPTFENYQSPLYYVIHAASCKLIGVSTIEGITYCGRALSFVAGILIIVVAWKLFVALGGEAQSYQWTLIFAFLALSGVFVRFTTLSGNDAFFWLSAGLCCFYLVKLQGDRAAPTVALLAFWLVLAIYVKLSALILVPAVLFQVLRTRVNPRLVLVVALAATMMLVPLFVRNLHNFGSLVPLASGFGEPEWRVPSFDNLLYAVRSSIFPWSEVWRNWLGLALLLPSLVMILVTLVSWLRLKSIAWPHLLLVTAFLAYVVLNLRYDQAEARYMFVAWSVIIPSVRSVEIQHKLLPIFFCLALCLPYALFLV